MAAELISAGRRRRRGLYRQIYEGVPLEKLELLARALASVQRFDDGRVTVAVLRARGLRRDRRADDSHCRGHHRPAAHGRRHEGRGADPRGHRPRGDRKVSLRATDDEVDVSAIARAFGGGGHRRAAGFSQRPRGRRADRRRSARSFDGRAIVLADKPAGITSHDVVARARRALGDAPGRARRHARSVRDRAADRARRPRDAARALFRRAAQDLRGRGAARRAVLDRRSGGGDRARRARCPTSSCCRSGVVRQRPPAYSAVKIAGERAYARARRGEEVVTAEREVTVYESELRWRARRSRRRFASSARPGPTCARSSTRSATPTASSCGARAIGPFEAAGALAVRGHARAARARRRVGALRRERVGSRARSSTPRVHGRDARAARRRGPGAARGRRRARRSRWRASARARCACDVGLRGGD